MLDVHCLHQPPSNPTPTSGQYFLHQLPSTPPTCSNIKLFTPTCPNNTMGNSAPTPHLQPFPSVVPSNTSHYPSFTPSSGMNTISSITPSLNSNIKTVTPTFPNSFMPSPSSTSDQHCLHQPYTITFNTFNNQSPTPTYSNHPDYSTTQFTPTSYQHDAPTVPLTLSNIQPSSKRQRLCPQLPDTFPVKPKKFSNIAPVRHQLPCSQLLCPIPNISTPFPNYQPPPYHLLQPTLSDKIPTIPPHSSNSDPDKYHLSNLQLPGVILDRYLQCSTNEAACDSEDEDSKLEVPPSPTPTPQ